MQLVKFSREGGKDVVIANWQAHPHLTGFGKADVSADVIGVMREEVEEKLHCSFVYFSGASGNLTIRSFDEKDNIFNDYRSHGKELGRYALEAAESWAFGCSNSFTTMQKVRGWAELCSMSTPRICGLSSCIERWVTSTGAPVFKVKCCISVGLPGRRFELSHRDTLTK